MVFLSGTVFRKEIIASASQPEPEPEPSLDPSNLAYTTFTHTNGTVYTFDIVGQLPAPYVAPPGMMVVRRVIRWVICRLRVLAPTSLNMVYSTHGEFDYTQTIAKNDIKSVRIGTNVTNLAQEVFQQCL